MKRFIIHQIWFYLLLAMWILKRYENSKTTRGILVIRVNQPKIERGLVDEPEDVREHLLLKYMKNSITKTNAWF